MLSQCPSEEMQYWAVENEVGNVKNQGPQLIEPIEVPKTLAL
jgi:putative SOS response-associated peptidase YedK